MQVVVGANACNHIPEMLPSRWKFEHFAPCPPVDEKDVNIGFFTIYWAVILEAFLWGAGTALGELPPYFVSRAASAAGGIDEELEGVLDDDDDKDSDKNDQSCLDRSKKKLGVFLKKYSFITVLLMASVSVCFPFIICYVSFYSLFVYSLYITFAIDSKPSL